MRVFHTSILTSNNYNFIGKTAHYEKLSVLNGNFVGFVNIYIDRRYFTEPSKKLQENFER